MKRCITKIVFIIFCFSYSFAEITLDSKRISYDTINEIITAEGEVIVIQKLSDSKNRELHCEKVEYNRKTGDIKLFGDTIIKEPTGEIIAAKNIELDDNFKKAVIKALLIVLNDNSKIKAETGEKFNSFYTFKNASYTPCNEKSCQFPLWDLVADKVIYDQKNKVFIYKNVKMRLKGIPIFYSPYFKHPSFEVKRQTGFLAPIIKSNSDTGFYLGIPYYMVIDRDKDLKITPFVNFKKRGFISGEYRQSFTNCDFNITSSILTKSHFKKASDEEKKTRWHIDSIFTSHNLDNKRITLRINRASDVTYKSKYPVDSSNKSGGFIQKKCNESKFVIDSFDRNYFMTMDSYIFQTPEKDLSPSVIPHLNFKHRTPDFLNGTVEFDSDTLTLVRNSEKKSPNFSKNFFRSSNKFSWNKEFTVNIVMFDFKTGARADIYNTSADKNEHQAKNKIFPVLENQISGFLPFISKIGNYNQTSIWGPKVTFSSIESFNSRKELKQNEDSVFQRFDDLNLHSLNRFGMYDKIENGERISYGLENSVFNENRRRLNVFVGKSQNIGNNDKNSNCDRNSTVGRLLIKPFENVSLRTRFVGFPLVEKSKMFETGINFDIKNMSTGIGYLYDSRTNSVRDKAMSQLGFNLGFQISQFWKISGSKIFNFKKDLGSRNLSQGVFLDYQDECFGTGFGIYKSKFRDKDIKPNTGFIFTIFFKNLGSISKPTTKYLYNSDLGTVE